MVQTPTYFVVDWDARFESAESRKIKKPSWVPVPNKHDGLGFRLVAAHAKRCELYAGWALILEVASKQPTRGRLHNGKCPLTARHLSIMTGFPASVFELCFQVLSSDEIGWIETEKPTPKQDTPGLPGCNPGVPGDQPGLPLIDEMRGDEMRQNERREGETSSPALAQKRFKRPELEDIREEFEGKGLSVPEAIDQAERFQAHYDSNGWKVGRNLMKDWRAAVRTWMQKAREFNRNGSAKRANGAPEGSKAVYSLKARQDAIKEEIKTIDNRTSVVATGPLYSAEDKKRRKELSTRLGELNRELANV